MPSSGSLCFLVAAAMFFPAAMGQRIAATILVGVNGSFFEPPTVSVALDSIVRFVFDGHAHSVVQASFDNPCFPLPGGFSSGSAGVKDTSVPPMTWDLKVTNISQPIWFYCANMLPVPHCTAGMVGAINPTSISAYNEFLAAAKAVNTLPSSFPADALSGVGAAATALPAAPPNTTVAPSSNTQSSTPTPMESSHKRVIIGSSVGGCAVAVLLVITLAWVFIVRRRRRLRRQPRESFDYSIRSPRFANPTDIYASPKYVHTPTDALHRVPVSIQAKDSSIMETMSGTGTVFPQGPDGIRSPLRVANETTSTMTTSLMTPPMTRSPAGSIRALPPIPLSPSPSLREQKSIQSYHARSASQHDGPSMSMHTFAREVAAVILQNTHDARAGRSRPDSMTAPAPPSYADLH